MILDKFALNGKTALVTGGAGGIGRSLILGLAEAGADIAIADLNEEAMVAVSDQVRALGRRCLALRADVTQVADSDRMVQETIAAFDHLDILVNCAGTNIRKPTVEITEEDYNKVIGVNLKGTYFPCRSAGAVMTRQRRGKIINIASLNSFVAFAIISLYAASKGAVGQLTKSLAVEWAPYNIQVNAIAPGFIKTDFNRHLWQDPERLRWVVERTPAGRFGEPPEVVGAAVFLASEASDFVTGHILVVDGGFLAGSPWQTTW